MKPEMKSCSIFKKALFNLLLKVTSGRTDFPVNPDAKVRFEGILLGLHATSDDFKLQSTCIILDVVNEFLF